MITLHEIPKEVVPEKPVTGWFVVDRPIDETSFGPIYTNEYRTGWWPTIEVNGNWSNTGFSWGTSIFVFNIPTVTSGV